MNNFHQKNIAVIGAGPMGLICAYDLLKNNHNVTIYERDDRIGGMSASFDLAGTKIERFYHFICATDDPLFNLLKELSLDDKLIWQDTKMGFYYDGKMYPWGDPISLLRFPKLNLFSKLRYALHVFYSKYIKNWSKLDKEYAEKWLKKWLGNKSYEVLWEPLFRLKFYEYQNQLSAAWIASRIRRVARSRKSILQESMGYLQGGSDTLLSALENKITGLGGKIVLNADVKEIQSENNQVTALCVNSEIHQFDNIITTIPLPLIPKMIPTLESNIREKISAINNIGVACVVMKLKRAFSPYFWMNINDKRMEIPGIIEYSNLNPQVGHVIYIPYYMPHTHAKYRASDDFFIKEVCGYLKSIKNDFDESWITASHVARYGYAQTVCTPNFFQQLPQMKTSISGLYMADTAFYYPEDRSISESILVGKKLAALASREKI